MEGPLSQVLTRIETQDPVRLSAVRKGLSADVDAIVLRCWRSAGAAVRLGGGELGTDVAELENRTIIARWVGFGTRMWRWGCGTGGVGDRRSRSS